MTSINAANRALSRHYASIFGVERPHVERWWNDDESLSADIVRALDTPQAGVTSYATLGVSDYAAPGWPPTEFLAVCESGRDAFEEALSTLSNYMMERRWRCGPGSVLENALAPGASETLRHFMLISPMIWSDGVFATTLFVDKTVSFLQALPISPAEREYARENGGDALEDRFVDAQIDIFDLDRPSILL